MWVHFFQSGRLGRYIYAVCISVYQDFFLNIISNVNFQDADSIKKICDIYDWDGKGELDMYYFMDIFYALGLNITKKVCVKFGQMDNYEKKYAKFDEVVKLVQEAVKEPENSGNYHDYIELCKLYDKNENGTMMLAELENFLTNLGKLTIKKSNLFFIFIVLVNCGMRD